MSDPWLSADNIATHLSVTKDTVGVWIAEKAMPAHKVGRLWKFKASEVDEWVRSGSAASTRDGVNRDAPRGVVVSATIGSFGDL